MKALRKTKILISGHDGELSLRRIMASIGFIVFLCLANKSDTYIITLASMVVSLMGITTYQNIVQSNNQHEYAEQKN